jgi:alpha-glucosidase
VNILVLKNAAIPTLLFSIALCVPGLANQPAKKAIVVVSPDAKVRAELSATDGVLSYRITADGKQVLGASKLGIRTDDVELGQEATLGAVRVRKINQQYRFFGAHGTATDRANEAVIQAQSHGESYLVDVHVANDGVGVRLRLPAKRGRKIQADRSTWMLDGNPTVWADVLDAGYESPYHATTLKELGAGRFGFPLTVRVGDMYVTLTEAMVKDYGDLAVKLDAEGALAGQLYADPDGWTTDEAVTQPWRVTILARNLNDLVNTTLVEDLNPPADPQLFRADWVKPGRSAWQWLASGDPIEEEQRQWVDWTSQLGFEYYLIDDGWSKWKDSWEAIASTSAYGKTQNVKIWIWVHSQEVRDPQARKAFFRKAVEAGVVGVKIDFPPACNREVSNWYYEAAKDAAEAHLLVDFHGANKPTGMNRTWPNVLTREGVRGHEYQITRYQRLLQPDHDVILPFTRYIAGPGDYTPTVFTSKELQGNTWGHELAQAVIFTSPFLCYGGHPKEYLANPARDVLTAIRATWDETRVLSGSEPGKVVAEARRSGDQWFVAVLNGADATSIDIPLEFLGAGRWKSNQLRDTKDKADAWDRKDGELTRADHLRVDLAPRGGFVGWIRR